MGLNNSAEGVYLNVFIGMNGQQCLRAQMPEANFFLEILMICAFQVRCLSARTPRDFVLATYLIAKLSRAKLGISRIKVNRRDWL